MINLTMLFKNCKMSLDLKDKVTVIVGDSATGKSSIHKLLVDLKNSKFKYAVSDNSYKVVYVSGGYEFEDMLKNGVLSAGRIYILDEGLLRRNEMFTKAIRESVGSYFIITSRALFRNLNYDLSAVKKLYRGEDGVSRLRDYITLVPSLNPFAIRCVIVEDEGKAYDWVKKLFGKRDLKIISSKGKEKVCDFAEEFLRSESGSVLLLFDSCSFGCLASRLLDLLNDFSGRVSIIDSYRSWEYLILNSNIFASRFKLYTIDEPCFEEAYYEHQLDDVSRGLPYGRINHDDNGKYVSKCYTEACCYYTNREERCNIGLSGEDKFVSMLDGTEFECMLSLAKRG